jgi:tetratricopeptide (TPR) repeat protein
VSLSHRAVCLAALGRYEDASAIRHQFDGIESDSDESAVYILTNLLLAAVLGADRETAATLSRRLAHLAACPVAHRVGVSYARLLGEAAALLADPVRARAYYEQALELCEKVRFRPEIAMTRLELAELLLEHYPDERPAAIEHLDFAIGEFREMKMQPSLERALRHKEVLKARARGHGRSVQSRSTKSSMLSCACRRMLRSVPRSSVACSGTVTGGLPSTLRRMWLPRARTIR